MAKDLLKPSPKVLTKRRRFELLRSQLDIERSTFMPQYRELAEYISPRRLRAFIQDRNRGDRRNQKIIDSTGTLAARTLRSGMMAGVTSPARPWFKLTTPDPDLAKFETVKEWLHIVEERMTGIFLASNLYNILPVVYGDMGTFGTGSMHMQQDFQSVVRFYQHPIGSYYIGNDSRLKIGVFMREFDMTVRQLVQQFGKTDPKTGAALWDNFSPRIKNFWDNSEYETWIDVTHVICPNDDYDPKAIQSKFKRFSSYYYERGMGGNSEQTDWEQDVFLSEKGYDRFPELCPRWEVSGEDVYGTSCPGMDSIGDIKALQLMHKRKSQAIEKLVNPPMVGPSSLKASKASILPGDITYSDEREGQKGFRPAHEVDPRIQEILADINDHQHRVSRAYFEDLFLMLSQTNRPDMTAREIDERHEEKLLALGPMLEQLNQDLLDPLIDNTFDFMVKGSDWKNGHGLIPPPPQELQGVDLQVEYTSIMAQAQKLVGISGVERFVGFVGQMAAVLPDVYDTVDYDEVVTIYGDMTSVPPKILRSPDAIAQIRQQKQQAAQAQQQAAAIQQGAGAAKDLSQADTSGDNALTALMDRSQAGT